MHADPFSLRDSDRLLKDLAGPTAYVSWNEILPIAGRADRIHVGNLLGWSAPLARRSLGASREVFRRALRMSEEQTDSWMEWMGRTRALDFLEHGLPFLRNVASFGTETPPDGLARRFLAHSEGAAEAPDAPTRASRTGKGVAALPESVILEITNSCNYACTMCSMRTGGFLADRTMSLGAFERALEVLGPHARRVRINGYGETTIVPNLASYLDAADRLAGRAQREIITNLSAPTETYLDLWSRGYVVLASWDGSTAPVFEGIRQGSSFEQLRERLLRLGRAARAQPERLGVLVTVQERNLAEVVDIVRLASYAGAGLVVLNMVKEDDGSPWMDVQIERIRAVFSQARDVATAQGLAIRVPDRVGRQRLGIGGTHRTSGTYCDLPWKEILVRWDCELTVCNMFNPFSYGMLETTWDRSPPSQRFEMLWTGPNARLFRDIINSALPHPYCHGCYYLHSRP